MGDEHILPVWLFENLVANLEQVLAEKDADERQLMALGIAVDLLGAAIDQASAVQ